MEASGMENRPTAAMENTEIHGLTMDSRRVEPGFLFAAVPGSHADGRDYIAQAVAHGAAAVLAPLDTPQEILPEEIPHLLDLNPRRRLALMVAAFYGRQPQHVAAVTGTNGKTSVVSFTRQIWAHLGYPAASLGTLGIEASHYCETLSLTTPDPVALIQEIAKLADRGVTHLAFEASSHGLEQFRIDGVRVTTAAFTNLSRDHLDYHGSMETYLAAKARLFREVMAPGGAAILNADAPEFESLAALCRDHGHGVIEYGRAGRELRLVRQDLDPGGQDLTIAIDGAVHHIRLPLTGAFQAMNALAALGLVIAEGGEPNAAVAALAKLQGVRGRLEPVTGHPRGAAIFVDYAHTPGALQTVLESLRPHTRGRLFCVFGAGGDRDRGKRPAMGAAAARSADVVFVTDDNPRTEDPAAIRAEVLAGCPGCEEIGDRARAIARAVAELRPGDTLLIAGKGHEQGQTVGNRVIPFDDVTVARDAVVALEDEP
ncbi:MAG: UDP-N-acetylmuramoyl-L-alanyl-D-glutamate--2,6-diaminopimelate ligase [Alphaproteobacteria bacterium]|nr:UDP-N-acetylmuramoyl-L-alanyl-D-glutamate--2,6-diaminopimelate ligase [Alphaproteobacteria bacterium]